MATQNQIDSFHDFATQQVSNGGAGLSIEQLFDLWHEQQPSAEELTESVAAVKAALKDMEDGDTGRPVEDVIAELRNEAGITTAE